MPQRRNGTTERADILGRTLCGVGLEIDARDGFPGRRNQRSGGLLVAGRFRKMAEKPVGALLAHRCKNGRVDVVAPGLVRNLLDVVLPASATSIVDEIEARGAQVHLAHTVRAEHLVERLIEQPRPVLDARDVQLRREAQVEREPCEQALADAVDGADERLRHLLGERRPAALDESLSDAVMKLGCGLDGERRRDDAHRLRRSLGQRALELPDQTVRLAAPCAGTDEANVRKIA